MTSGIDEHPAPKYPDAEEKLAGLLAAVAARGDAELTEVTDEVADHVRYLTRQIGHLEHALESNRRVGTAMGILITRHRITEDQAFAALRRVSQDGHRKLRDVAEEVVLTGELPQPDDSRPAR